MRFCRKQISSFINHPIVAMAGILATTIILGVRLFQLVNEKAVNLLFWDQYDFYRPLFTSEGWTGLFLWQHGIHRQGLGGILTKIVADASHWNGRVESFFILGLVYFSLLLILLLKYRLSGRFSLTDIVYPWIILNAYQYEIFIGTTNITPAGLSLFLICLYAVCWTISNSAIRYTTVLVVNFLAVYTGYSMFLGIITVFLFGIELLSSMIGRDRKRSIANAVAFSVSALTLVLFFVGYQVYPSAGCTNLTVKTILRYPLFMGLMLAKSTGLNYTEIKSLSILVGICFLGMIITIVLWSLTQSIRNPDLKHRPTHLIVIAFIGFALLYSGAAAVGRSCQGMMQAQASRYVTLMTPALIGLFFGISTLPQFRWRLVFVVIGLFLVSHSLFPFPPADQWVINYYYSGKTEWKACYLQEENAERCTLQTGFQVYPIYDQRIQSELDYLKEHRLNLYLDATIHESTTTAP